MLRYYLLLSAFVLMAVPFMPAAAQTDYFNTDAGRPLQIEDAYAKAKQLGGAPEAAVVRYAPPFTLGRFLRALGRPTNRSCK